MNISPQVWFYLKIVGISFFVFLVIYLIFKYRIFENLFLELEMGDKLLQIGDSLKKKSGKMVVFSMVLIVIVGAIFLISSFGMPKLSMDLNIMDGLFEKEPSLEVAGVVEPSQKDTIATTTTTTTTKKKSGFLFFDKKEEYEGPTDCKFGGRGHEAILMPSGYYYCRSTENRVTIKNNGVDVICCVTP
ncbi:hypothetical protein N9934_01105 [Desulfosarcina sp.]|nr:hypothetical protein [Desulfosarcina sp.]